MHSFLRMHRPPSISPPQTNLNTTQSNTTPLLQPKTNSLHLYQIWIFFNFYSHLSILALSASEALETSLSLFTVNTLTLPPISSSKNNKEQDTHSDWIWSNFNILLNYLLTCWITISLYIPSWLSDFRDRIWRYTRAYWNTLTEWIPRLKWMNVSLEWAGRHKGSPAAWFQSVMYGGYVPVGGIFATLTSWGMLGTLGTYPAGIAGGIATGVAVLERWPEQLVADIFG
ncbi:hypothetical protein BDW69DRAFT_180238 [Aspergillus filifer]